jgi:hypothetical protein
MGATTPNLPSAGRQKTTNKKQQTKNKEQQTKNKKPQTIKKTIFRL